MMLFGFRLQLVIAVTAVCNHLYLRKTSSGLLIYDHISMV